MNKWTWKPIALAVGLITTVAMTLPLGQAPATEDVPLGFDQLQAEYAEQIQPIVKQYCLDCHSAQEHKGEFDLERFATLADVRRDPNAWQKVAEMLDHEEMPPAYRKQPSDVERQLLRGWIDAFLDAEALANAGDPGPVILRRLSNAEYNYTLRDLTGIESLDPTREFPVDGAAGEGFTNAGSAQAMSPSLVQKYLDAAKEVAAHAVLLPDGIAFSPYTTQRDQTDEWVGRIQAFYRQFTADGGGQAVNLQGIQFDTNQGGLLPLGEYLSATLEERDALRSGEKSLETVAAERSLNAKYFATLWQALAGERKVLPLIDDLRQRWASATPDEAPQLLAEIAEMQAILWKYNSVGHIGRDGQPVTWMEPISPITTEREFNRQLTPGSSEEVSLVLVASDAGDGRDQDYLVWKNPRLGRANGPDIPLQKLAGLRTRINELQERALARTADYLDAAALPEEDREVFVSRHELDADALGLWLDYLALGDARPLVVEGHVTEKHASSEHAFIRGWGTSATPIILGNASDTEVRIPGIARPHAIVAHPSPTLFIAAGWQSPINGIIRVEVGLSDAHPECGNGQEWLVQHRTTRQIGNLGQGEFATGGSATLPVKTIAVREGELVSLILGPRGGDHTCDLTEINLVITEVEGEQRVWDLAKDCSGDMQTSNPHADRHGHAKVWHFYQGPMTSVDREAGEVATVPEGSLLAHWQRETDPARRKEIAQQVQALATGAPPADVASPDGVLYQQLQSLALSSATLETLLGDVPPDDRFGKHPLGHATDSSDLIVQAPAVIEFRIPAKFAEGATFVATAHLDPTHGQEGSVRLDVRIGDAPNPADQLSLANPIVIHESSNARQHVEASFAEFRDLFPPALCYARIVPVDEVVTLTLFYREDDHLQRLMLNDAQIAQLNRLWDELFYIAQEPLKYEVAFEQLREFATQDRPDLVETWAPLVEGVERRATAFRRRLLDTQPTHVQAVLDFAKRAWRRPLTSEEQDSLRALYQTLRHAELPHDEAIRLTLARVLTSPAFLYRLEKPGDGPEPVPVTDVELATRLSYFLWSSLPDEELRSLSNDEEALITHTRRMLRDPRTRRLAEQFACQWLHVRDFDQTEEKNERLYPDFVDLREDMYEETVRYFADLFRNDGSILNLLDSDHTFLNETLAGHYGIDGVHGNDWRRVDGVRARGRGGVLGMATVLASQSGASRTSPILRGNWVYETLLGEELPRPPDGVPVLPDESPQGLTARQLIEQHSSVATCAACHAKIDPYGFALEQYDAVGRLRPEEVDTQTTLADGHAIEGIDGLRDYLLTERRDDFVRQFCRKLLGYALGREVLLSDRPLIDRMMQQLAANDYRFSVAVEAIVLSDQFRKIRGRPTGD